MKKEKLDKLDKKERKVGKKNKNNNSAPVEKIKKLPKFGILDAVIILLIISIGVGIAFRYNFFNTFARFQELDEYAISYSVKNIEHTTPNYIDNGDEVYFKDSGEKFGTIMEISDGAIDPLSVIPSTQTFVENASTITVTYPPKTRIDANGRIKCEGKISADGTFLLNGSDYISAGQKYVICTEKVTLEITIQGIEPIEKD